MAIAEDLRDALNTQAATAIGTDYNTFATELTAGLWTAVGIAVTTQEWLVPAGGTPGQVLTKDTITDYDTSWQTVIFPTVPAAFIQKDGAPGAGQGADGDSYFDTSDRGRNLYLKVSGTWNLTSNLEPPMDERTIGETLSITGTRAVVPWATSIRNDDSDLSYAAGVLTNDTGTNKFDVFVDFNIFNSSAAADVQFDLEVDTGVGYAIVSSGTRTISCASGGYAQGCIARRLTLNEGDSVRVMAGVIGGGPTADLVQGAIRLERV